jgi:putative tricarboxylic transport membrane protein
VRNSTFDLWVMLLFGFLGYLTKEKMFPLPPFILGLILGPQMELYFRQAAVLGLTHTVHRPVAMAGLILAGALFAAFTIFKGKGHPIVDDDQ